MCGVIAVLRRQPTRIPPSRPELEAHLERAVAAALRGVPGLGDAAEAVESADRLLRGVPGTTALLSDPTLASAVAMAAERVADTVRDLEVSLDAGSASPALVDDAESLNAALVRLKDAVWALSRDRLGAAAAVGALWESLSRLAGDQATPGQATPGQATPDQATPGAKPAQPTQRAVEALMSIQTALGALDRLEVRGRDSAGLHLMVTGCDLDLDAPPVANMIEARNFGANPLFANGAVRRIGLRRIELPGPGTPGPRPALGFVYKAAAEIGELGYNVAQLRAAIANDALLARVLSSPSPDLRVAVLGHTRWASVGSISEPNAHPLNSDESVRVDGPYVVAVLNGDVENHLDLRAGSGLELPAEITTDAKVIPTLVSRRIASGLEPDEAFRQTVGSFDGSVAIAASVAATPDRLCLALKGSGQGLYVGLAEDAFVVASEPYGLVEETSRYMRMDGEATGGQVVILDAKGAGTIEGVRRLAYDGTALPVGLDEVSQSEITTRDIDRSGFAHFLLKEITEAPQSFRKTLRGKVVERDGRLAVSLGEEVLPDRVRDRLASREIQRVLVIGQGTAAIAGQSVAAAINALHPSAPGVAALVATSLPATELSGFALDDDMSDTLVVVVSQSGTTTDTNRTVDLVRGRGATVIAIVNRRNSDLVHRADGVLYTSDGRDVEMAVPSTKAFYAQVAAGFLLALGLADACAPSPATGVGVSTAAAGSTGDADRADRLLRGLRDLPSAMETVVARRDRIASAAALAPARRHWAVVGNGANRIAAEEVRIKLSELCYKSISCDTTENKKHIDLSAEPLIFVCAAGLDGATADDVAKEIAIYRAHRAAPVVVATEGDGRFAEASAVIEVPAVDPGLAFVLSAMAGHLFGYEAALSIDAQAGPLRQGRAAIESVIGEAARHPWRIETLLRERLLPRLSAATAPFLAGLAAGAYDGTMQASTAVRLTSLLRCTTSTTPMESYEQLTGKVGPPVALLEDLTAALTEGIDELTRPIDAIKHQAKTVTVGISRAEDDLLGAAVVRVLLAAGARRDHLPYRSLRTLATLDPAIREVTGYSRYHIEGSVPGDATIHRVDAGGIAAQLPSRTDKDPVLRGTKHRAATEREVTVAKGASDGRTVVIVPEVKDNQVTGIDLLHVRFVEHLDSAVARAVLTGYRGRYAALVDAVTETVPEFDDGVLGATPVVDLLTQPVHFLAERWRTS